MVFGSLKSCNVIFHCVTLNLCDKWRNVGLNALIRKKIMLKNKYFHVK